MNNISTIHYAIEIDTGSNVTNSAIGIQAGLIRYTTDGYHPFNAGATYENGDTVTGLWNGDLLKKKGGISASSQSVSIVEGGDFAYSAEHEINLINHNQLHKIMLQTGGFQIIGKPVKMWVVIDDVFISRFAGVVSEAVFTDNKFTIKAKDKNNSEQNTVENFAFGLAKITAQTVVENAPVVSSKLISHSRINGELLRNSDHIEVPDSTAVGVDAFERSLENEYNGVCFLAKSALSPDKNCTYEFHVNTNAPTVTAGMVAVFSTDTEKYKISEAENYVFALGSGGNEYRCRIVIDSMPKGITDFVQYYGRQPVGVDYSTGTPLEIATETAKIGATDNKKLFVSIFEDVSTVEIPSGFTPLIENGMISAVDNSGNVVMVPAAVNGSSVIVSSVKTTKKIVPNAVQSASLNKAQLDSIAAGTFLGIDSLVWRNYAIPNNFSTNDDSFFGTIPAEGKAILLTVEEDPTGYTPIIIMRSKNTGKGVWAEDVIYNDILEKVSDINTLYFGENANYLFADGSQAWQSQILSGSTDQELYNNAMIPQYEIEIYNVFETQGNGRQIERASEFYLPNVGTAGNRELSTMWGTGGTDLTRTVYLQRFDSVGIPATNAPKSAVIGSNNSIHTDSGSIPSWYKTRTEAGYTPIADWDYPDGSLSVPSSAVSNGARTIMLIVRPSVPAGSWVQHDVLRVGASLFGGVSTPANSISLVTQRIDDNSIKFSFECSTIGYIKEQEIDTTTLKYKMAKNSVLNVPSLLSELTGSTVVLPNRQTWITGGSIEDKTDRISLVTKVCKQSFVVGHTSRTGEIVFTEINGKAE